jgi:prepilin-type processing-associated H-X9-DG protein
MLFIDMLDGSERQWHVGESVDLKPENILDVQADGDELSLLIRDFHGLVYHNGRTNVWYGDTAKMIGERICQLSDKNRKDQARKAAR